MIYRCENTYILLKPQHLLNAFCIFVFMRYNNKKVENLNSFFCVAVIQYKVKYNCLTGINYNKV